MHKLESVLLGSTVKVKAYKVGGMIIRRDLYSAAWRRIFWVEPQSFSDLPAIRVMRQEKNIDASSMFEAVPYPSLKDAVNSINAAYTSL